LRRSSYETIRRLRIEASARERLLVDGAGAPLTEKDSGSVELLDGIQGTYRAIAPDSAPALQRHRKRQAEERLKYSGLWKDDDLVFPSQKGTPMGWNNLTRRNFKPLLKEAGLPQTVRFYDLRHTFATWMLEQGENPKIVQEILGHSQITHTMDT
jgi:integrase